LVEGARSLAGHRPGTAVQVRRQSGLFFLGYGDWCGPASATLIGVGAAARATVDTALTLLQAASA
jgi:hypothetical protein